MNISMNTITEIEQIYADIMNGPETPLREQLYKIMGTSEKETMSRLDDVEPTNTIIGIMADHERIGFVAGFVYARTLFG